MANIDDTNPTPRKDPLIDDDNKLQEPRKLSKKIGKSDIDQYSREIIDKGQYDQSNSNMDEGPLNKQNKIPILPSSKLDNRNQHSQARTYSPNKTKFLQSNSESFFQKDGFKLPVHYKTGSNGFSSTSSKILTKYRRSNNNNIHHMKGNGQNNAIEKKVLDDNLYSYSSSNYHSLIYIADDYLRKTMTDDVPFKSFNELSRTNYNPDNFKLKQLLKEQEKARIDRQKRIVTLPDNIDKTHGSPSGEAITLIKKQLDYNKNQEILYINKIDDYLKELVLPIKQKQKEDQEKLMKMPKIKVLPSKNPHGKSSYMVDSKDDLTLILSPTRESSIEKRNTTEESNDHKMIMKKALNIVYRFFWMDPYETSKWRPDVRESATFTTVGKSIILYAGISNTILEDLCIFDPSKQQWQKVTSRGEIPLFGRHGHTACEFKKTLVVFGGERRYNQAMKLRECLNDLRIFNPETCEWKHIKSLGKIIDPRRNHGAVVYEKSMFVYGGINSYGVYLKDVWALNFKNHAWTEIVIDNGYKDTGVAFHTMNAVFIDKNNPILKDKRRVYPEGFYVFGGKDQKDKPLNTLKILKYENKIYSWEFPEIAGSHPIPRYKHVAIFYEPLGILLIHGGRNDSLQQESDNFCLSDINILNLEYMQWAKVTAQGYSPKVPRCSHNATLYNSNLLIFGGFNGIELCGSVVRYIELNQTVAKVKILDYLYKEGGEHVQEVKNTMKDDENIPEENKTTEKEKDNDLLERERQLRYIMSKDSINEKMREIFEMDNAVPIKDESDDPTHKRKKNMEKGFKSRVLSNNSFNMTTYNSNHDTQSTMNLISPPKKNITYMNGFNDQTRKHSFPNNNNEQNQKNSTQQDFMSKHN